MRTNLKVFRVKKEMTQEEMADAIGCSRPSYACIENGIRDGRTSFWTRLQKAFDVPESEMFHLMLNE